MKNISINTIRLLATLTMVIDHIGVFFLNNNLFCRFVGRMAFVLYAFMISQGALHTSNKKKYLIRLLLLAVISELPFDYIHGNLINWKSQNVIFTLFLGYCAIYISENIKDEYKDQALFLSTIIFGFLAEVLKTGYGFQGVLLIGSFYYIGQRKNKKWYILPLCLFYLINLGLFTGFSHIVRRYITQAGIFLAVPVLLFYDANIRPKQEYSTIYHWFYPVHLIIIGIIKVII